MSGEKSWNQDDWNEDDQDGRGADDAGSRDASGPGDDLVDDLVDGDFDWKRTVRAHPIPSLVLAALGGFFLGRRYGMELVSDVSAFAADELLRQVPKALDVESPWQATEDGASGPRH